MIFLDAGCLSCEQIQSVEKLATTSPLAGKNASGAWAFESRLACVISTPATATSARRCCSYRHQYMLANSMCVSQIRPPYSMWCSNGQQQKLTITLDRGPEPRYIRWSQASPACISIYYEPRITLNDVPGNIYSIKLSAWEQTLAYYCTLRADPSQAVVFII